MRGEPDIWVRLARLDDACHVAMRGLYLAEGGSGYKRVWEVEIRLKHADAIPPVVVRGPILREAIETALSVAEARGWPDGADALQRGESAPIELE